MNTHVCAMRQKKGLVELTAGALVFACALLGNAPKQVAAQTGGQSGAGSTASPAGNATGSSVLSSGGVRAGSYLIQPGDIVQYRVWPNAELTGEFPVESSGLVYLPMLGAVQVGGKTVDDTRNQLRDMYAKLVQGSTQPVVTVSVQFGFSVTGGVLLGGVFEGHAGMTVFDAVSRAGGYRNEATPKYVDVMHTNGTTTRLETAGTGAGSNSGLTSVLLQSQDRVVVPVAHRTFTTQNIYLGLQMVLGLITVVKLFGK